MMKFVDQFTASPTLLDAVLASLGITSDSTTQVTGPRPMEKDMTNTTIAVADTAAVEVLIPIARATAATDMTDVGPSKRGREPTLYDSVSPDTIEVSVTSEEYPTSIRNAGTIVRGILAITINKATKRDSPLNTGFKIRVEKYMTACQSSRSVSALAGISSPGEIPQVC